MPSRRRNDETASRREPLEWYLLFHQLPPRPLYLRAKVRQKLAKVGAIALKGSIYALPRREDCLEDFEWIAAEARAGGGGAWVAEAAFLDRRTDGELVRTSRRERDAEYLRLAREAGTASGRGDESARFARARKRLEEIGRVDFFGANARRAAEVSIEALRRRLERRTETMGTSSKKRVAELVGRMWVTRRGVKVDRISSAWFVRRFVDPKARFRFIDPKTQRIRSGEIGFDIVDGDFTHEGDRCSFETLLSRTGVADAALIPIAQIVHDIDLKDSKYGRPEAAGVSQVLAGVLASAPDDKRRLERGFALFDELYASFRQPAAGRSRPARGRAIPT